MLPFFHLFYALEENEELGRHLVATEDIKLDHILFKDKPLLLSYKLDTLEYTRNKICLGCYKEIPTEPRDYRKDDKKRRSGGQKVDKKQKRVVGSGNNEDNDEEKDDNDEESSSEDDEDDDDDDDDESDDSDDEDNDDDEPEKVCLSCHLPICSVPCSSQYFHKNFECKLLSEAASFHRQQQLQQNSASAAGGVAEAVTSSTPLALPESGEKTQNPTKKAGTTTSATSVSSSSLSSPASPESNSSSSNQESMSLGTTCINTSCSRRSTNRTSISNGIREALLRNLLYFRCLLLKHVNEGHWNELISLQSNEESRNDVTGLEKTTRIFTLIKKTLAEINHPSVSQVYKPDVHKIVGIIEINALNISISQNVEVSGIFPTVSLMEHSCIPSVKYYLVPCSSEKKNKTSTFFELYCRSAVKLKSGDHLSVAYTNAMWNTEKRREFLKKEKHFWCDCVRCKDPWELGTNFSTLKCPICKIASVPVLKNPGGTATASSSQEIQWKCTNTKCGKTIAFYQVKKVDNKLCEMVGKTKPSIESYKECLAKMEELVHPDYYLCCIVTHSLIQMYGHDTATVHDKALLEEKIASCNKLLGMIKKLDPGLAVLNIYASVVFYEMHSAILAMAGAEVDDDYHILRNNPETVNLAKVYLQKCIECFKYELLELPENKLKVLAAKKMEYLNLVMNKRQ
ncbi:unnamed protein product [Orchesella dallaii]|uniref:Protein msta n=1 Tax=Orchesella dallaii TaxID=48710 RepID=A0ABP1QQ54_9HEXA